MKMKSHLFVVVIVALLLAQQPRACAPSCTGANVTSNRVVNKTIDRVLVSGVIEAQWRGMCHSLCINVSLYVNAVNLFMKSTSYQ